MRVWTVQARPGGPPEAPDIVLVKEGFSWPAFFLGPFWFAWKGLWWGLLAYVVAIVLLGVIGVVLRLGDNADALLAIAVGILFAAQANDLWRAALARRGYAFAGIAQGKRLIAEQSALAHWPPHRLVPGAP